MASKIKKVSKIQFQAASRIHGSLGFFQPRSRMIVKLVSLTIELKACLGVKGAGYGFQVDTSIGHITDWT